MNNEIDQLSGTVKYYGVKINGVLVGGQYLSESIASDHGSKLCKEGDSMMVVPVTSAGSEMLFG